MALNSRAARTVTFVAALMLAALLVAASSLRADPAAAPISAPIPAPIEFTQETLPNGLQVIYAPLHQAPVVNIRVLYHVGSRDERPDRQGFAHMFEHMMFRGSFHVKPEEHMRTIGDVGGMCNAYTSFDQTVYYDTVPAEYLETALYLEADRMSSFKVSDEIYRIERKVVAREWGIQQNRPYGTLYDELMKRAFTASSYRWTPIGNMDHLRAAAVSELQDFFNTYYLPNNAVLVIAGDFDTASAKAMVSKYFGWIPAGPDVVRRSPPEPPQTAERKATVPQQVPLSMVVLGFHMPPHKSNDQYAIGLLSTILGHGRSSRLERLMVSGQTPLCVDAFADEEDLEDGGIMLVGGTVLGGHKTADVKAAILSALADVRDNGVTEDELNKAKAEARTGIISGRQTADDISSALGGEQLVAGDAARVNQEPARIEAVTAEDIKAAANEYFRPEQATALTIKPDPLGIAARRAATQGSMDVPVVQSTMPVKPRDVVFPAGYPVHPPLPTATTSVKFAKGTETMIDGVRVIVMPDHRLPTVNFILTLRGGWHAEPPEKRGLGDLTSEMLSRGCGELSYPEFSTDLESRGIGMSVNDNGDNIQLIGNCTSDQLDHAVQRMHEMLVSPTFSPDEFARAKDQKINALKVDWNDPRTAGSNVLWAALYPNSPLGRFALPRTVQGVTLDDVKAYFWATYVKDGAVMMFCGDITPDQGQALARTLLDGVPGGKPPAANYKDDALPKGGVIVVDRPEGAQSVIRIGRRAYDLHDDAEKYTGAITGTILSAGIESRLMVYVRATKGLVYGVSGYFQPNRHGGAFIGATDTKLENTGETVAAMYKVFADMRSTDVGATELANAQKRVAGSMVMGMQTVNSQAGMRVDGVLNGYPIDYYDRYADNVAKVRPDQIRDLMNKYVDPKDLVIVVVAPAAAVKDQLAAFGPVTVIPMPTSGGEGRELMGTGK